MVVKKKKIEGMVVIEVGWVSDERYSLNYLLKYVL